MPDTLAHYAIQERTAPAPFAPGDTVVEIATPQFGSRVVCIVEPHPKGGWRIGWHKIGTGIVGVAYDDDLTSAPEGWCEPPVAPLTAVEQLRLSASSLSQGPDPEAMMEARASDIREGRVAERARFMRLELAVWWAEYGADVNPELAKQQIEAINRVAARIEAEAGTVDPRDPDPTREGIFRDHNCSRCKSGERACVRGNPRSCEWPHARND